jgi:hypothetical protein
MRMSRTWKTRVWLSSLVTAVLIVVSYEVKTSFLSSLPAWFLVVVSFLIGNYGCEFTLKVALKTRLGRRLLMGDIWMEGLWLVRTEETATGDALLASPGIAEVTYRGEELSLITTIYRPELPGTAGVEGYFSTSEMVFLKEPDLYCNYFKGIIGTDPILCRSADSRCGLFSGHGSWRYLVPGSIL